jgi:hypothetical protein
MKRYTLMLAILVTFVAAYALLVGCNPVPVPTPTPTPIPTPTPTPTPTGCYPPLSNDPGWFEVATLPSEHVSVVTGAELAIGSPCGLEPEATLETLGAQIRKTGLCAGRLDDAVFVQRADPKLWEEWHAVSYLTGCWTEEARAYKGMWHHE